MCTISSSAPWARLDTQPWSLKCFLLLGLALPFEQSDLILLAQLVYAAYGAFNHARTRRVRLSPEFLRRMLREKWIAVRTRNADDLEDA